VIEFHRILERTYNEKAGDSIAEKTFLLAYFITERKI
jgi:hypothetical protein